MATQTFVLKDGLLINNYKIYYYEGDFII